MYSAALITKLRETGIPTARFGWETDLLPTGDFIVYAEDSSEDLEADGKHAERATEGTVHLYTRDYTDAQRRAVEAALESMPTVVWGLNSIMFEDETKYVHYAYEVGEYGAV